MRGFRSSTLPAFFFLAILASAVAGSRVGRALAAALPVDDARSCTAYVPLHLAGPGDLAFPFLSGAAFALLPLPAETAKIVCAWAETAAAAGQMSRRDSLWFQAGYGGMPGAALSPETSALPKWDIANPSIFRVLPGTSGTIDPNPFAFPPRP